MIDLGLTGKGAVVSGAGYIPERAGHGRICALKLAEAGAAVACIDIDKGRAEAIAAEVREDGGKAFPIVADMTVPADVQRAVDEAVDALGSIDACVDIIGGARWERADRFSDEDWPQGRWAVDSVNPLAPPRSRDIGNAVLFLCSALAERITGQTLVVDGGAIIRELWGMTEEALPRFQQGRYPESRSGAEWG